MVSINVKGAEKYVGHKYVGHKYVGHKYVGQNCVWQENYVGKELCYTEVFLT
jgi:hypothetical protein